MGGDFTLMERARHFIVRRLDAWARRVIYNLPDGLILYALNCIEGRYYRYYQMRTDSVDELRIFLTRRPRYIALNRRWRNENLPQK